MKKAFGILLIFIASIGFSQEDKLTYTKAIVYTGDTGIVKMAQLGIAVDDGQIKKNEYIIRDFNSIEIKILEENNFNFEVLIQDVQDFYIKRNNDSKKKEDVGLKGVRNDCNPAKYETPQNFSLGSMGGFYTYDEINAELDSMHLRFPTLVSSRQSVSNTTSIEGRNIYYVRLSNNSEILQDKPRILYVALTHAREPAGMQQLFFYMYYLLENYETNSTIAYILDNCELYFVPCANPDGYVFNQTTNPNGGGMHRKNTRPNNTSNPGVDLNRNYGYNWGYDNTGSSPNPQMDTYRGTEGFSEPETYAIKEFTEEFQFTFAKDIHCYSNLLIYPWGFAPDSLTEDSTLYITYSSIMTEYNGYAYGTPNQTVGYTGNGGAFDWFHGEQITKPKTMAWTPEAGDANDGFWPEISRIEDICEVNLESNIYLALFSTKYARVKDIGENFINESGYFKFNIQSLGLDTPSHFTVSIEPITSNISEIGNALYFNTLNILESSIDSIYYELSMTVNEGDIVEYKYKIETENGQYYSDVFTKIVGSPQIIFEDDGNSMDNWISTHWDITDESSCNGNFSITDSPYGNYPSNAIRHIISKNEIDLTNATYSELRFCTKWDLLAGYDYVELSASIDDGYSWEPLCGKNTKKLAQNDNNYAYDGSKPNWIQETVSLNNYLGKQLLLKFELHSSWVFWIQNDGFYFDDMKILAIIDSSTIINNVEHENMIKIWPNPAYDIINIEATISKSVFYSLFGIDGRIILQGVESKNSFSLNINNLEQGMYFLRIESENINQTKKIIIKNRN